MILLIEHQDPVREAVGASLERAISVREKDRITVRAAEVVWHGYEELLSGIGGGVALGVRLVGRMTNEADVAE